MILVITYFLYWFFHFYLVSGCMTRSGDIVQNNATWPENDCTICTCINGKAECKSMLCETRCSNPRKVPGQCCPVCDGGYFVVSVWPPFFIPLAIISLCMTVYLRTHPPWISKVVRMLAFLGGLICEKNQIQFVYLTNPLLSTSREVFKVVLFMKI